MTAINNIISWSLLNKPLCKPTFSTMNPNFVLISNFQTNSPVGHNNSSLFLGIVYIQVLHCRDTDNDDDCTDRKICSALSLGLCIE